MILEYKEAKYEDKQYADGVELSRDMSRPRLCLVSRWMSCFRLLDVAVTYFFSVMQDAHKNKHYHLTVLSHQTWNRTSGTRSSKPGGPDRRVPCTVGG